MPNEKCKRNTAGQLGFLEQGWAVIGLWSQYKFRTIPIRAVSNEWTTTAGDIRENELLWSGLFSWWTKYVDDEEQLCIPIFVNLGTTALFRPVRVHIQGHKFALKKCQNIAYTGLKKVYTLPPVMAEVTNISYATSFNDILYIYHIYI